MMSSRCPVNECRQYFDELLASETITLPRSRHLAEEIFLLLGDIAWGRGGGDHLSALRSLGESLLSQGAEARTVEAGRFLLDTLSEYEEVFVSHIQTHNCATGDCVKLAPSPCQMACPAGLDIPSYVTLIGMGREAEAIRIIREDNPFPWVCGLVCTHPCEFVCVRGRIDKPIAIKDLKGYAAERAMSRMEYVNPPLPPSNGRKVCIVGAGPAGLTAAYYLRLKGYQVTILEALPVAGGMMMVGIPRYRLPREVIDREVGMIEDMGVEIRRNTRLGRDVTIEQLREEGYEAFLIAIGAHSSYKLMIPGEEDFPQVISAVDFLRDVALGERHAPGKKVAVIGGGNVAIDAARTCIRLGCESVTLLYRRTRSEMPAHEIEVRQAEEEGVQFQFLTVPVEVKGQDGRVTALHCLRAELGQADASGRRRPIPVEGSDHDLDVDCVIAAIGQAIDSRGVDHLDRLKWSKRGTIKANTATMETSQEGVFAAGDVVTGPATVIEAIGMGKVAADAIDRYLQGIPQPKMPPVPVRRRRLPFLEVSASKKMRLERPRMAELNTDRRRITFQQVELGLTQDEAREEALRCLRCDVCRRCGLCVEICRDKMKIDALKLGYLDVEHKTETDFRATAERCITCGACATHCPNDAMQIEDRDGTRVLSICGTVLNQLKLEYCEECGSVLGPERYHDFIMGRMKELASTVAGHRLCLKCARKKAAAKHAELTPPVGKGI
ncbi:putative selenate reductase, YgfK subunit [Desulfacinum hydrothermale DSM 13146]|uniref:Putative selenate reductase, YgfK subunit n=1 Tax=Desulfacinum hydrothermale DSM 13146 TaxID=1121390 RepID=A0A1W1XET9_9BACT|nr:NAD(P)-binding protein [Desulfacinum hydrothermale]SMC22420.1 putative selenate reductase, YgfK subunit [Desulfacinum hydrothermale DSM 13146]